jgi:hypothetical protein
MKYIMSLLLCLILFTHAQLSSAASQKELEAELKEFGILMGYAGTCAAEQLGNNVQDQEVNQFALQYVKKFISPLGQKTAQIFEQGAAEGVAGAGLSQGRHCDQALGKVIALCESTGFTGNYFKQALKKRGGYTGNKEKFDTRASGSIGSIGLRHSQTAWAQGQCIYSIMLDGQGVNSPNGIEQMHFEFFLSSEYGEIISEPSVTVSDTFADSNATRYLTFHFQGDCEARGISVTKATARANGKMYDLLNSGSLRVEKFEPLNILLPRE